MTEAVLVIDDDPDLCEQVVLSLESNGHPAVGALSGQEALDLVRDGLRPKVILLDLMMPVMNGAEFYRRLNDEFPPGFPVAVCSGDGNVAKKAAAMGVRVALQKPFDTARLLSVVDELSPGPPS